MKLALLVAALCVAAAVAAPPSWSNNWSSDQIQSIRINQGGVASPDGSVCCPPNAPECKIQTAFTAAIVYNWYDGKKSAMKNPDGSGIVSDYVAMKEYSVTATGECQAYCPLQAGSTPANGQLIFVNATDEGQTTYNGQEVDAWFWAQKIPVLNITMESSDFYVTTGAKPMPIAEIDHITPFGQQIGQQNQTFVTFTEGVPAASHFVVKDAAKCPMSQQCGNSGGGDDDAGKGRALSSEEADFKLVRHMGVGFYKVQW